MISPVKIWRNQKEIALLAGKSGRIISYTMIRVPMAGFNHQAPYVIAILEIEGKRRLTVQLVDCENRDIKTGMRVWLVVRRIREPDPDGVIPYGIKGILERQ
jgi:hypothetical protein